MTVEQERFIVSEIVRQLSNAIATAYLYTPDHPQVLSSLALLLDPLRQLLQKNSDLTLIVLDEDVLYLGKPLDKSPHTTRLAKHCVYDKIGYLRFLPAVDASDLRQLVRCLVGREELDVLKQDFSNVNVGGLDTTDEDFDEGVVPIESFEELTTDQLNDLDGMYKAIGDRVEFDLHGVAALVAGFVAAFKKSANPLMALVPIRNIDDYTFTHSINVGILNIAQGMSLGVDGPLLHDLGVAGMLHDAGKIFVDKEIIQKPGKLDDEEWKMMQTHPTRGAQYLMGQKGIPTVAVICSYEHHMRYDLSGYPAVSSEWSLHLCSQMTMISDTFDALRTQRAYKDAWDFPKVSGLLLELAGKSLNPDLTLNFLKVLAELGEILPEHAKDDSVPLKRNYCE